MISKGRMVGRYGQSAKIAIGMAEFFDDKPLFICILSKSPKFYCLIQVAGAGLANKRRPSYILVSKNQHDETVRRVNASVDA